MADYMAGKKPQGRIQEASQSVGSIATINKEPLIGLMKGSESGGYLLSHNAVQYHRRCCLSALCPLSAALASLRPLSRAAYTGRQTRVIPTGAEKIWSLSKKVYRSFFFSSDRRARESNTG